MNPVMNQPLMTRQDLVQAAVRLLEPLTDCLTPAHARMIVGEGSAHYSEDVAGMEGWSRALWALVPMLIGKCPEAEPFWALWKDGLIHGTDPDHPEYWGDLFDYDQRMVEMAVIGVGLSLAPERFWQELEEDQRQNLFRWLNQINVYDMPKNNWRFFRILVNIGFRKVFRLSHQAGLLHHLGLSFLQSGLLRGHGPGRSGALCPDEGAGPPDGAPLRLLV